MITASKLAAATNRHQAALLAAFPQKITLASKEYDVAAIVELGSMEDGMGGFRQGKMLQITIFCEDVTESILFDTVTNVVKRQTLTMNGVNYRIQNVYKDPQDVVWTIEATEAVI